MKAKNTLLELAFLQKQKTIEQKEKPRASRFLTKSRKLFDTEQVGILDLNKAKIAWIQEQFVVEQIEGEIQILVIQTQNLERRQCN